jgi:chloramphenicol-sensitive protein RarD
LTKNKLGLIYAFGAYFVWGFLPIYWKLIENASSFEILANRGIWSLVVCTILLMLRKQLRSTFRIIKSKRMFSILAISSGLLTINWGVFIWAVGAGRVVESALGYYITPLLNVLFGILIFRESLRALQWLAVAFGLSSVLILAIEYNQFPWISLSLALSWGTYSLVKKLIDLGALESLTIETLIAFIPNLIFLFYIEGNGTAQFGQGTVVTILLCLAGGATVIPLLLFNGAIVRLPLSTLGLLQYITPTIFFLLGVFLFNEDMSSGKVLGFMFIWVALIFLGIDLVKSNRNSANRISHLGA